MPFSCETKKRFSATSLTTRRGASSKAAKKGRRRKSKSKFQTECKKSMSRWAGPTWPAPKKSRLRKKRRKSLSTRQQKIGTTTSETYRIRRPKPPCKKLAQLTSDEALLLLLMVDFKSRFVGRQAYINRNGNIQDD